MADGGALASVYLEMAQRGAGDGGTGRADAGSVAIAKEVSLVALPHSQ